VTLYSLREEHCGQIKIQLTPSRRWNPSTIGALVPSLILIMSLKLLPLERVSHGFINLILTQQYQHTSAKLLHKIYQIIKHDCFFRILTTLRR